MHAATENLLSRKLQNNQLKCWSALFVAPSFYPRMHINARSPLFSPFKIYGIPVKYLLWRLHCLRYMGLKSVECLSSKEYLTNQIQHRASSLQRTFQESTIFILHARISMKFKIEFTCLIKSKIYFAFISLTMAHVSFTMNLYLRRYEISQNGWNWILEYFNA